MKKDRKPFWDCECGRQEPVRDADEVVDLGKVVFRKEGCPGCRRPMRLRGGEPPRQPVRS